MDIEKVDISGPEFLQRGIDGYLQGFDTIPSKQDLLSN